MQEISVRVGGQAGDGIASIGESIARCFSRMGLHVFGFNAYQSVIRGGHVWFQARAGTGRPHSQGDGADVLYALDRASVEIHAPGLRPGGTVVYDAEKFAVSDAELPPGVKGLAVPTLEIARKFTSQSILQNGAGIGATAFLAGIPLDLLHQVLADSFGRKAGQIVDWNLGASADGYRFAEQHGHASDRALPRRGAPKLLMTGNQAIALGAAAAGLKFLAQYPMTPASSIMHWLAAHSATLGVVVKQAEDEIAAINMAIGASFAGVRSMTATSGGGFSLMVEALGMAGMTETPLVVVESQRAGPSTGLPTKTEQGDLNLMLGAGQSEFPRAILAPSEPHEAYAATVDAFRLAEEWQTPILLASDLHLSENFATVDREEIALSVDVPSLFAVQANGHDYRRYQYSESGVSPRAIPGQPGLQFVAGSDEHDEKGHLISDVKAGIPIWVAERTKMMDKRMRKLAGLRRSAPAPVLEGPADAPLTFVAWGSTVAAIRDAMEMLTARGRATNLLRFPSVYPIDPSAVQAALGKTHQTLLVEANYSGQFGRLLRAETGVDLSDRLLKYDGEPFYPHEVAARALEVMHDGRQ
ncbi:MAG TPA: 2-oxoacid:acceptor oxidoreductase subunit alpha [Thermoplasmata archaeon]|nr:2-oxoacid:acceptor oxidoreductase subunit alpha [Thermoplasmata archaeon]